MSVGEQARQRTALEFVEMSQYHDRTLKLLGSEGALEERSVVELTEWARTNDITLPAAYLEWARLDGARLLRKYSNDDWFFFEAPEIIVTPEGVRGLLFHQENQGNFNKIVTLDQGDDPPVLFEWTPPWVSFSERFSDCIFAQIFDWQYWLEFDPDDPESKEITYSGDIRLRSEHCVRVLRRRFEEGATTRYVIEGELFTEYRFLRSLKERMRVLVGGDGAAHIHVTGEYGLVERLEAELLEAFSEEVIPPAFNSILWAVDSLGHCIDRDRISQLRHTCIEKPNQEAIDRVAALHRERPLRERVGHESFPRAGSEFALGGPAWGITIRFRSENGNWWSIVGIEKAPAT